MLSSVPLFCAQTTTSQCFGLIFVEGTLNPANSSGLNFSEICAPVMLYTRIQQLVSLYGVTDVFLQYVIGQLRNAQKYLTTQTNIPNQHLLLLKDRFNKPLTTHISYPGNVAHWVFPINKL